MKLDRLDMLKVLTKNLNYDCYEGIYKIIGELKLSHIFIFPFSQYVDIIRIRPSESEPFSNKSEISYNSQRPPNRYGRANKCKQPMFYGSFLPPGKYSPYATSLTEMNHILANGNYEFINDSIELTFGEWSIKESFKVIPMTYHNEFLGYNEVYGDIKENYSNSPNTNDRDIEILDFISLEFAKTSIQSHFDYQITAAFTNYVINKYKNIAEAIIYPSVRSNGKGYNICITPNFVDRFLELKSVFTAKLYVKHGLAILDKEKSTSNINADGSFSLDKNTESGITKGRDWCLRKLDELNKIDSDGDQEIEDGYLYEA